MQAEGEARELFKRLISEIELLARAMGISFGMDIVQKNLAILDALAHRFNLDATGFSHWRQE